MTRYREQVRQLQAEVKAKRAIIERQLAAYQKSHDAGGKTSFAVIQERNEVLERQITELERQLAVLIPLAEQEPEPEQIDTSKHDKQALELLKALYALWQKSDALLKQDALNSTNSGMLIIVVAKELKSLLVRLSISPVFLEIGKRAGIDWDEVR